MKIYVGNLSYNTTDQELRNEFEAFGVVDSVSIVTDRDTGKPRGFAFVEMSSASEVKEAIAGINGKTLNNRTLVVNEARPKTDNRSGSYGSRNSGGSRGGYDSGYSGSGGGGGRQRRY